MSDPAKIKAPLVMRGPGAETTIVHFGLDIAQSHDETVVAIVQNTQVTIIGSGEWSKIKNGIDDYFKGIQK